MEMTTNDKFKRSVHYDESYKEYGSFNDRQSEAIMDSYKSLPKMSHSGSAKEVPPI